MIDFRHLRSGPASFWIMRHGQSEGNVRGVPQGRADHPLTGLGREQAMTAGAWFRGKAVDVILTSPLKRARETAAIVAEAAGVAEPLIVEELTEIDTGVFTDLPWTDIADLEPESHGRFQVDGWEGVEGAERASALTVRAETAWGAMLGQYAAGRRNVLAVSHAGFNQWLVRRTFGYGSWMPLFGGAGNCSTSLLQVRNDPVDEGRFSYYAEWTMINSLPWENGGSPKGT
jgi:phosphoserine phosphatase